MILALHKNGAKVKSTYMGFISHVIDTVGNYEVRLGHMAHAWKNIKLQHNNRTV